MAEEKTVKDLMIPLEDYPHVPHWFTLGQAVLIVREAAIKYEGPFEPRAMLIFDEKYQLLGILTLKDLVRGLEEELLAGKDPDRDILSWDELLGSGLKEQAKKPVSEAMSPFKVTVNTGNSLAKALALMLREGIERIPVLEEDRVAGLVRLSDLFREISEALIEQEEAE